jgi:hypothetical protein
MIALLRLSQWKPNPKPKETKGTVMNPLTQFEKILILPLAASIKMTTSQLRNPINRRKKRKGATSRATQQ